MKRFLILLLTAALCLSLMGCGMENYLPDIFKPKADRDSLLLCHSAQMAEITGAIADNFELLSYPTSLMEIAGDFTCLADEQPEKAWITDVGDIGTKITVMNGQLLGTDYLACAGGMTHGTLVQMPEALDDRYGVLLEFDDAYSLVVYDPVEDGATAVTAYPVFPEIAEELIDRYFDDVEPYDEDEIEKRIKAAENISLTAKPAKEKATAAFYEEKALQVMEGVANAKGKPDLYTTSEEVLAYCDLWMDMADETPTDVEVWVLEDPEDLIKEMVGKRISDDRLEEYFRRAMGGALVQQMPAAYGDYVVASVSVMRLMAKSTYLGPAPENQGALVMVVLTYDEATAMVCIYDSGYGLNQYAFGFVPGELEMDPEDGGFERLD